MTYPVILRRKKNKIIARIGKNLLENESALFNVWHEFKADKIIRYELLRQTNQIKKRIGELLEQGSYTDPLLIAAHAKLFCKKRIAVADEYGVMAE